ncbi:hypothetical protein [Thalassiella azotivora]
MTTTTSRDFTTTSTAQRNRARKARALADAAVGLGRIAVELQPVSDPGHLARRHEVRRAARVRTASAQTWALALADLEQRLAERGDRPCSSCSSPVRRVMAEGGRWLDIDPLPHPAGNVHPLPDGPHWRVLNGSDPRPDGVPLHRDHLHSCPHGPRAVQARRRAQVLCHECGRPLDVHLLELEPHTTHPACDLHQEAPR